MKSKRINGKTELAATKKRSRRARKSVSGLVIFQEEKGRRTISEPQRAAERLQKLLKRAKTVKARDDRRLLINHVAMKFA